MLEQVQPEQSVPTVEHADVKINKDGNDSTYDFHTIHAEHFYADLAPRTLCCLAQQNELRKGCIWLIRRPEFDAAVLLLITANAVIMAMDVHDPMKDDPLWLARAELAFTCSFTIEMALKVVSLGFVIHEHSYLRAGWNQLDFVIVVTAWIPYFLWVFDLGTLANSSGLRAFRMLRPLRTINRLPTIKKLVESILLALPQATVLLLLIALFFLVYSIIGIQLFQEARPLDGTASFDSMPSALFVILQIVTKKGPGLPGAVKRP